MRLVLLGAPGAGKGTQATALAKHFDVPHISSGELLRARVAAGSSSRVGPDVAERLDRGELVSDDVVIGVVSEALAADEATHGYVLEGFPRTVEQARQAEALGPLTQPCAVVLLDLPDEVARKRLAGRARDGRSDDLDPEVADHRLRVFHKEAQPLLDFYRSRGLLVTVDADQPPATVTAAVLAALRDRNTPA